eukprot:maker-scaffold105_size367834-snap-gene-2.40 protein:Tk10198 transcript:maker-scaffold105_size367834-snap-gene-2.40-mRNA-1 annotation:"hypothetical protein"
MRRQSGKIQFRIMSVFAFLSPPSTLRKPQKDPATELQREGTTLFWLPSDELRENMSFIKWFQRKRRSRDENIYEQKSRRSKSVDASLAHRAQLSSGKAGQQVFRLSRGHLDHSEAIPIPTINLQSCGSSETSNLQGEASCSVPEQYRRHSVGYMSSSVPNSASSSYSNSPTSEHVNSTPPRRRNLLPSPHRVLYSQYCDHLTADYGSADQSNPPRRHSDSCQECELDPLVAPPPSPASPKPNSNKFSRLFERWNSPAKTRYLVERTRRVRQFSEGEFSPKVLYSGPTRDPNANWVYHVHRRNSGSDYELRRRASSLSTPHRRADIEADPDQSACLFRTARGVSTFVSSYKGLLTLGKDVAIPRVKH